MKRLIALLVAVGFCVMLFVPPLAAKDHDPAKPLPWMDPGARPNGDEGGWHDVDSVKPEGIGQLLFSYEVGFSKYFTFYFAPKTVKKNKFFKEHEETDLQDSNRSGAASSR